MNKSFSARSNHIFIAIVKNNTDAQKMGRLQVWIPELGGDPTNPSNWYIVNYASPFAGVTPSSQVIKDSNDMGGSQSSYGMWFPAPDIDNQVLVCFANGDASRGFWIACLWQKNMNHMVPGIASATTLDGKTAPTVEYNKRSVESTDDPRRPEFTPLAQGLRNQGLDEDQERGWTTASARRESPSAVMGILSKRGNQIYIDDEPDNELIRLRTRSGAQILIHEATGYVYINSKNGESWVEVSDIGVDIYSRKGVSVRSEGNVNIRADRSINLSAGEDINMLAGGAIYATAAANIETKSGASILSTAAANIEANAAASVLLTAAAKIEAGAGADLVMGAGGNLTTKSGGNIVSAAGGTNARTGSQILDNSGGGSAGDPTQAGQASDAKDVARKPAHEPWGGHPKPNAYDDHGSDKGDDDTEPGDGEAVDDRLYPAAAEAGAGSWLLPTNGLVGSQYGMRTLKGVRKMHNGVDIRQNNNEPVYASRAGRVVFAGVSGSLKSGYGRAVYIDHGNGLVTRYAHLSSIKVQTGQQVKQGHVIGLVGNTGGSTGPHLHFEILHNGNRLNPKNFMSELGTRDTRIKGGQPSKGA